MGKLFIVSGPIGNLDDITLRALKVLGQTQAILAEDTRSTTNLLKHHQIATAGKKLVSFFEGNEERKIREVIRNLQDTDVVLISESGTPLISDPGFKLVREVIKQGYPVESIPGPTAAISALVISGLPTNAFLFLGFLPKKDGRAKSLLTETKNSLQSLNPVKTILIYESPHRLIRTLSLLEQIFGDIDIVVARELTKIHEEIRREKVSESIKHFNQILPLGEFTILFPPRHL